ncbi:glucose-1-phosphate thymidylyltransferase [Patescibacteria group bacterium]|nr:MAG: glucose-1-phosphate thymidylyltransferase [Patescibacteria group bacterium]
MKALIAAGGHATRLRPITATTNKHLIPLAGRPMIFYALDKVTEAGIKDIAINVNPGDRSVERAVGDGSRWGARVAYIEQLGGPLGLAHIVKTARPFLGEEPFVFYLGDNIVLGSIRRFVEKFQSGGHNALLALAKVPDPERFGVPEIRDGKIVRVDEKPVHPKSDFAVTGIYFYDSDIFKAVDAVRPSARGEYEISDAHTWLIEHGYSVGYEEITGWWKDTGKPEDLLLGNRLLLDEALASGAANRGRVHESATLVGKIRVGRGTVIGEKTTIHGPVWIGEDCVLENASIGPYTSLGNRVTIKKTELAGSIVFDDARLEAGGRVAGSLIGYGAQVVGDAGASEHKMIIGDNSVVEI